MEKKRKNGIYTKIPTIQTDKLIKSETMINSINPLNMKSNIDLKLEPNTSKIENNNTTNKFKLIYNSFFQNNIKSDSNFFELRPCLTLKINGRKSIEKRKSTLNIENKYFFSENEQYYSLSKSFNGDIETNKTFRKISNELNGYDYNKKKKNSICFFKSRKDNNYNLSGKNLNLIKQIENNYNNSNNKSNIDPFFIDENEIVGQNIEFLKGKNENFEINQFENTKKNNIASISINLLIKKIAMDNLRTNYNLLYKSFLQQYKIFISLEIFIEKIIKAFYFYKKVNSIEYLELINLLNNIIANEYSSIVQNEKLMTKLKELYQLIKDNKEIKNPLKEDFLNVYFILFNENDELDLNMAKYLINNQRKKYNKNNIFFIKETEKQCKKSKKDNNNLDNIFKRKLYFYIFDYSEEEIAIKLTNISYKLMSNISVDELLNSNFSKKDKKTRAPNVTKIIQRFDKLTLFIIEDIFSYDEPKKRADSINKWINIAKQCKKLNNFNDTLVINTCFSNYLMKKIPLTWKKVSSSTLKSLNTLRQFCTNDHCYINIRREIINRRGRFFIPYLGILLKDIVNLEEKYKYILNNGNINCCKIQKLYILIYQFFEFKNYPFTKETIYDLDILENLSPKNEEQLESLASKIEPKLIISSGEDNKRKTKTDFLYYMNH